MKWRRSASFYEPLTFSNPIKMFKHFLFLFIFFWAISGLQAQEIKTKVSESGFGINPDAQKEEVFEEARMFVFGGIGYGRRAGNVLTGFSVQSKNNLTGETSLSKSTDYDVPFLDGFCVDLGFRYFFHNNFGIGFKGNYFRNSAKFVEVGKSPFGVPNSQEAVANTNIWQGSVEGLYRYYLHGKKESFLYGAIGIGFSNIDQTQEYRYGRITEVATSFILIRPAVGINIPVWDVLHFYSETGYAISQGKISEGNLSLSQFQISAGVHIRLNSF